MFQLSKEEFEDLRFHIETIDKGDNSLRLQNETSKKGKGGNRYLPYAFTEQGVAMLSGILNSDKAINMPARMKPFGREHSDHESVCRSKKSFIKGE